MKLRHADFGLRIGWRITDHEPRTTMKLIGRTKPFAPIAVAALGL